MNVARLTVVHELLNRLRGNNSLSAVRLYYSSSLTYATTTTMTRNGNLQKSDWNRAVSEAEKIVGYPSSFLNLRWLLSDEIANVAKHLRRLVSSNHPLLKTAKGLLYNGRNNMQAWGLIVLLVSKAAGHLEVVDGSAEEDKSGVLRSQRVLAEIAEMIRTSHLMHNGLMNIHTGMFPEPVVHNDMCFGNKIALLSGDYLLANSYSELSALKNQHLMELISSALRDLSEAEFMGRRDVQNNLLPSPFEPLNRQFGSSDLPFDPFQSSSPLGDMPMTPALRDWTRQNVLSAGSLLGKSCQGTLLLAGHGEQLQKQGFLFGKHLSLAWQAYLDLEPFLSSSTYTTSGISFNLTSAPVMFQLEHDPSLFQIIDKGSHSVQDVDYVKVHNIVTKGPGIDFTKQLQKEHSQKAMEMLDVFDESDARTALSNIIVAMDRE